MRQTRRQLAFDNMQISAAHAARPDLEQNMTRSQRGLGSISDVQRTLCDGNGSA